MKPRLRLGKSYNGRRAVSAHSCIWKICRDFPDLVNIRAAADLITPRDGSRPP